MRLHVAVLIFSIFWVSLAGLGAVAVALQIIATGRLQAGMLIPFGMLLFFYLMVTHRFRT